jgi:hypothetical protein
MKIEILTKKPSLGDFAYTIKAYVYDDESKFDAFYCVNFEALTEKIKAIRILYDDMYSVAIKYKEVKK